MADNLRFKRLLASHEMESHESGNLLTQLGPKTRITGFTRAPRPLVMCLRLTNFPQHFLFYNLRLTENPLSLVVYKRFQTCG